VRDGRDRRVVDDAVDDHVDDVGVDLDRIGGDLGDAPGELSSRARCSSLRCTRTWW
jgi:hypothetical protein